MWKNDEAVTMSMGAKPASSSNRASSTDRSLVKPPVAKASGIDGEHQRGGLDAVVGRGGGHRGADGEELDDVRAPAPVAPLVDLRPHHARAAQLLGLGLHALHGQLARVVERLGEV